MERSHFDEDIFNLRATIYIEDTKHSIHRLLAKSGSSNHILAFIDKQSNLVSNFLDERGATFFLSLFLFFFNYLKKHTHTYTMSLQLDYKRFHRRARYLANKWKVGRINTFISLYTDPFAYQNDPETFQNVDAIAVIIGDDDYETPYVKSLTLQVSCV